MSAQPHRFATGSEELDGYEESLRAYTNGDLLDEYEKQAEYHGARIYPGESVERERRCRREVLRRMSR
jgi:hypothetical protein